MLKDLFFLSVNGMRKRKLRSWLTLLGIFIGIAAVVSLISLGDGLRTAITGQFGALSADTLVIQNAETGFGPPGSTAVVKLNDHDIKIIESTTGVKLVVPRLIRVVKVEYNKNAKFQYIASLPPNKDQIDVVYTTLNLDPIDGRILGSKDLGKVLLGNDFYNKDLFGKQISAGSKILVQGKEFSVVGILKRGSSFTTNGVILMNQKDVDDILNIKNEYDLIAVKVANKDQIDKVAKDITDKIRRDRNEKVGEEDFTVQTPIQSLAAINTILTVVNVIVIGIALISLFIGGIGIANTMYTSVLERTKEIGTMKAIGAKNSDILSLFVLEAGLFGFIGGAVGSLFGITMSFLVSTIANQALNQRLLAFNFSWPLVLGAVGFSFVIGIIAGFVPSYQASKLKPVDALRA